MLVQDPAALLTDLGRLLHPAQPALGPWIELGRGLAAVLPQQRTHTQLRRPPLLRQLLPITDQLSQVPHHRRRQPHPGQIPDAHEVRQQPRILVVGLVRALLHPFDIARMSQMNRPASTRRQFLGQIGRPGTTLDRRLHDRAVLRREPRDCSPIIRA